MRRLIVFCVLGVAVVFAWNAETEACRHRSRRCSTVCYPTSCPIVQATPAPRHSTSPLAALQAGVTSTRQFVSPNGRTYRIHRTAFQDMHEEHQVKEAPNLTAAGDTGDRFRGTDRKAAKTSIALGNAMPFLDIAALRSSLPADTDMIQDPDINKDSTNQRTTREQKNVRVRAFLFAAAKEKDNDFHLILGMDDAGNADAMINSEVSGLPDAGQFLAPLKTARDQFKAHFGANLPGRSYDVYDPPIPVEVSGSLFFDIDHAAGTVGPGALKPSTAWEIHPITGIIFEP